MSSTLNNRQIKKLVNRINQLDLSDNDSLFLGCFYNDDSHTIDFLYVGMDVNSVPFDFRMSIKGARLWLKKYHSKA